ncbi:MAG: leucine-rich repeat domain-containing protein [Lachnospiraceae bacterium]|nr:leucine-rich repeat domain-containing protein [Lachnospiraceae bacterium]
MPTGALFEVNGAKYKVTEADTKTRTFSVSFVKVLSKKVKTFKVPTSVTYNGVSYQVVSIGKKAFMGCKKLKTISIGSNVKTINDKAFYSCSVLKSITIPSSVTKIGKEAFAKCKKLSSIKIKSNKLTAGKIGKNAFKGIKSNATFKVPKKKMKAYKAMLKKKGVGKKAKFKKL